MGRMKEMQMDKDANMTDQDEQQYMETANLPVREPPRRSNLPADPEAARIMSAAQEDAGFAKLLKFKKGEYSCDGEEIPLGTTYVAHCIGWTKCWLKFQDSAVVERKVYPVASLTRPPERAELGDLDSNLWPKGLDGRPADPWVYQYVLPFENPSTGDVVAFVTGSFGGKRAVADLCAAWARRRSKDPRSGQPLVRLAKTMMPSKKWGDVPRPHFEIVGWDGVHEAIREVQPEFKKDPYDDEIPF